MRYFLAYNFWSAFYRIKFYVRYLLRVDLALAALYFRTAFKRAF